MYEIIIEYKIVWRKRLAIKEIRILPLKFLGTEIIVQITASLLGFEGRVKKYQF